MSVPVGTTPTFVLTFAEATGVNLTNASNVYVTFQNGGVQITKTGENLTVEALSITVTMTQEEMLQFFKGAVEIQANWTTPDGKRIASEVVNYCLSKQLLMREIE